MLLRESLEMARNKSEAEKIISQGEISVDGKVRKDSTYPVGLMDVVEVPKTGQSWRVLFDRKGYIHPYEIEDDESGFKLLKVAEKVPFKGGKFQIALEDGKTLTGEFEDINVGDTIKVDLPDLEILDHFPRGEGAVVLVTGGSNVGRSGKIKDIEVIEGPSSNEYEIEGEGEEFRAPEEYVFVVGDESSEIKLPEAEE